MIGYYAHQHGSGHCRYAHLMAKHFKSELTVLTSYDYEFPENVNHIRLADENPDGTTSRDNQVSPPDYLHYSPVGQQSIQERSLKILETIKNYKIRLLIVDVSAEIAALARSSSVPYAYVKLPGDRSDPGHMQAFQGAVFLIAFYPEAFEDPNTPKWVKEKTVYLGFQPIKLYSQDTKTSDRIDRVTVISGKGGNERLENSLPLIINRFKNSSIHVLGEFKKELMHSNIRYEGFVNDLEDYLLKSDLIIANCGMNTISELLQIKKPYLAIPEDRPFGEQQFMASRLVHNGLALNLSMISKIDDATILEFPKDTIQIDDKNLKIFKTLVDQNFKTLPSIPQQFRKLKADETYEYI